MSELRVDNIVSADGTAAPIYSKGLNIAAGQILTTNGDFVVGGATCWCVIVSRKKTELSILTAFRIHIIIT